MWANPNFPNLPDFRLFVANVMRIGPGLCPQPVAAPPTPTLTPGSAGSLASGTYYVKTTIVSQEGETTPSAETSAVVTGPGGSLAITAPAAVANGVGWNVYASLTSGDEVLQNATPFQQTSTYTLETLVTGTASPPIVNMSGSPFPQYALDQAIELVICVPTVPGKAYTIACYNCAGHILLQLLPDQPGTPILGRVREQLGMNAGNFGIVQSAADQGTSDTLAIPDALKQLTLEDLGFAQSKWGRAYLAFNQSYGDIFGLT